jgi:hypothetical protein
MIAEQPPNKPSLANMAAHALGRVVLAVLLIGLIALAVAFLSPVRESVLRPWWR